jgi:hypothetical protein
MENCFIPNHDFLSMKDVAFRKNNYPLIPAALIIGHTSRYRGFGYLQGLRGSAALQRKLLALFGEQGA